MVEYKRALQSHNSPHPKSLSNCWLLYEIQANCVSAVEDTKVSEYPSHHVCSTEGAANRIYGKQCTGSNFKHPWYSMAPRNHFNLLFNTKRVSAKAAQKLR